MTDPKKEKTLHELEQDAITLAKADAKLTADIDAMTENRTKIRKERNSVELKITRMRINAKA